MSCYNLRLFLFIFFCCLIASCTDVQVNFHLNGQNLIASDKEPTDSTAILKVFVGDEIIFTDKSTPIEKVKTRKWDLDGDGVWEHEYKNKDHFSANFDTKGLKKITFCAGDKNCVSKWVYVRPYIPPNDAVLISFTKPDKYQVKTNEKYYDIVVKTENILSKDELKLLVNTDEQSFNFNETTGILTKKIRLSDGENKVEVISITGEGTSEFKVIDYTYSGKRNGILPYKPPPPPLADIDIKKPAFNITTKKKYQELAIKTTNLINKRDLVILLNGIRVEDFRSSIQQGLWLAKVELKNGKNIVEVYANSNKGNKKRRIIDYEVEEDLPNIGTAGLTIPKDNKKCSLAKLSEYTFVITPRQSIELLFFTVYSNICGGIEIQLGGEKTDAALVKGKNQISLIDLSTRLKAGASYNITCKTLANYGACESKVLPKLEDASSCNLSPISRPEFSVDYKGKALIYNLKYFY